MSQLATSEKLSDQNLNQIGTSRNGLQPTVQQWANVFGPSAYEVKEDENRNRKRGRVHIPDVLLGPSQFLTDRVDGLIVDATASPFTTIILPYMYIEYPDKKIEWNVWSFDQGLASRVPYEAAARTLTQRKQSFSGYTVRQGLAITMEHNFMMSEEGMANFKNQVLQVVQSIQNTNDLDVHMALINAPSYLRTIREKYYLDNYLNQSLRDYIDTFGFVQKNANALDIIVEDTKAMIKTWGGDEPDFMLCSSKLCFQMTMDPAKTNYLTQGPDGKKTLKEGPMLQKFRGLNVIKSKAFSMDEGMMPRDLLRRRVRVGEHYVGSTGNNGCVRLYNEDSDDFPDISMETLKSKCFIGDSNAVSEELEKLYVNGAGDDIAPKRNTVDAWILLRLNIEHYMLGLIIGRGGLDHLGATLWGQTEMSVFDDGQHGVWGMTYKYHERAIVFNERNMHRIWDVAYDGYLGGKGMSIMNWNDPSSLNSFKSTNDDMTREYSGPSIIAIPLHLGGKTAYLPSPTLLTNYSDEGGVSDTYLATSEDFVHNISALAEEIKAKIEHTELVKAISAFHSWMVDGAVSEVIKPAGDASQQNEATSNRLLYAGTAMWGIRNEEGTQFEWIHRNGNGHHGVDYTGVASVRNGKSLANTTAPLIQNHCANPPAVKNS